VLNGTGIGSKYGTYNKIETTAGGNHYGVYSEVLKPGATNFAGYFLGNVAIGTTTSNIYTFPASRGTNLQIMQTNGSGIVSWQNINTALNSFSWLTTGNLGTTSATNFLGTTDDIDLVFRRNNVRAGFIGNPNTATGNMNTSFGAAALNPALTGNRNSAFGANALNAITTGTLNVAVGERSMFLNTTGSFNTAIGVGTLYSNVSGDSNTAIGRNALTTNTSSSNTAIGRNALQANSTGDFNTGIGRDSMFTNVNGAQNAAVGVNSLYLNSSGGFNTGMGVQSLRSNSAGNNNAALGYQSGFSSTGSNNVFLGNQAGYLNTGASGVFIGNQAGYNETGSNKLYIENSNANADNTLIYGEFDNNIVRVNGTLQISNPATANGYALPIVRGTAGQVLQTDGAGGTSWANSLNSLSIMRSNLSTNQALTTAGWQKINFNTVVFDTNSELNTGTSRFTALKAGYYQVNAGFHTFNQFDTNFYAIGVFKNGSEVQETGAHHFGNNLISRTINCIVYLAVGDYVEIFVNNSTSGSTIDSYSGKTYFEVNQIR
jgi:trimeric autotransporter adhesin